MSAQYDNLTFVDNKYKPNQEILPVKIVIPAYKATSTLPRCIKAILSSEKIKKVEITVVNNGGHSEFFLADLNRQFSTIKIISDQEVASAAYARNCGASNFKHGIIVFIDADVEVEKDALSNLIEPLQNNLAEASVGNYSYNVEGLNFFQKYKQLYISRIYSRTLGYISHDFWSAICAVKAEVFHDLGGFDLSYTGAGGEDTELGIRLSDNYFRILCTPTAIGKHLHHFTALSLIKNDFKKGVRSMSYCLNKGKAIADNRHAKQPDIWAVILATAILIASFLNLFPGLIYNLASLNLLYCLGLVYLIIRSELIVNFFKGGLLFTIQSIPLIYILDLVRLLSVLVALNNFWLSNFNLPSFRVLSSSLTKNNVSHEQLNL